MMVRPMIRNLQYKCLEIEKVPYFISKFSLYRYKKLLLWCYKKFYGSLLLCYESDRQLGIRKFTVQLSELSELSQKIPVLFWNLKYFQSFQTFRLSILSKTTISFFTFMYKMYVFDRRKKSHFPTFAACF